MQIKQNQLSGVGFFYCRSEAVKLNKILLSMYTWIVAIFMVLRYFSLLQFII